MENNQSNSWFNFQLLRRIFFCSGFIGLCYWFHQYPVWDPSSTYPEIFYRLSGSFRLIFLVYFILIQYSAGVFLYQLLEKTGISLPPLSGLERDILQFFSGAAFIRFVMLVLGILKLYYTWICLIPICLLLIWYYPNIENLFYRLWSHISSPKKTDSTLLSFIIFIGICVIFVFLYIDYGLVFTDGDFLFHYNTYYIEVIRNHSIAPNMIWYHYFISKGAGLTFLSILLSDRFGIAIPGLSMLAGLACIAYSLVYRPTGSRTLSMSAAFCTLAAFLFLPKEGNLHGFFEKHHAEIGAMMVYTVWLTHSLPITKDRQPQFWICSCGISALGIGILFPIGLCYLIGLWGIYFAISIFRRDRSNVRLYLALVSISAGILLVNLVWNYFSTGLMEATPFSFFIRPGLWDSARFGQWCSPVFARYFDLGQKTSTWYSKGTFLENMQGIFSLHSIYSIFQLDRIEWFFPEIGLVLLVLLIFWKKSKLFPVIRDYLGFFFPTGIFLILVSISLILIGYPVSAARQLVYLTFFFTISSILLWAYLITWIPEKYRAKASTILAGFFILVSIFLLSGYFERDKPDYLQKISLFKGDINTLQYYNSAGNMPITFINTRNKIGLDERILTTNASGPYGLIYLFGRGLEVESISSCISKDWHKIVFGDPITAQKALFDAGINYFLVDPSVPPYGALSFSPLFQRKNLQYYFSITWTDNIRYLLTWRKPGDAPIPEEFFRKLKKSFTLVTWEPFQTEGLYREMRHLYQNNE